jgi:hypothetical protein
MRKKKPVRPWKTFVIGNGDDARGVESAWQTLCQSGDVKPHHFLSVHRGDIETNVPTSVLRQLSRWSGVSLRDYVSDVEPAFTANVEAVKALNDKRQADLSDQRGG